MGACVFDPSMFLVDFFLEYEQPLVDIVFGRENYSMKLLESSQKWSKMYEILIMDFLK